MIGFKINSDIGNSRDSRDEDVLNSRQALSYLGYEDKNPDFVLVDSSLDKNIRSFQKSKGLKVDGFMSPGGETEEQVDKSLKVKILNDVSALIKERNKDNIKKWREYGGVAGAAGGGSVAAGRTAIFTGPLGFYAGREAGEKLYTFIDKLHTDELEKLKDRLEQETK